MLNTYLDTNKMKALKGILLQLGNGSRVENVYNDVENFFKDISLVDVLLIELELINNDDGITIEDVQKLSHVHPHLFDYSLNSDVKLQINSMGHPVQVLKAENIIFETILSEMDIHFQKIKNDPKQLKDIGTQNDIQNLIVQFGEFHNHYHYKEKLLFPIMEQYGYFMPARIIWREDDRIRALYQALKKQTNQLSKINFKLISRIYHDFVRAFKEMIFQEEALILPVLIVLFTEKEWLKIAKESKTFGYTSTEVEQMSTPKVNNEKSYESKKDNVLSKQRNISFGAGY